METVFEQLAPLPRDEKVVIDARHARWASPYGLTTLLCVAQSRLERADFTVPENPDTASYWARTGFFRHAAELYELHGHVPRQREVHESDVLLEITPIVQSDDVHGVVGRIKDKSAEILHGQLGLDMAVTGRFGMTLSEACGNIVEHAGLVAGSRYKRTRIANDWAVASWSLRCVMPALAFANRWRRHRRIVSVIAGMIHVHSRPRCCAQSVVSVTATTDAVRDLHRFASLSRSGTANCQYAAARRVSLSCQAGMKTSRCRMRCRFFRDHRCRSSFRRKQTTMRLPRSVRVARPAVQRRARYEPRH